MPHIHTGPGEHDATASALIIRYDMSEPRLLLHMHKKLGKLIQPGGHVESDETPWQAILHEITEETGYEHKQLHVLQPVERLRHLSGVALHPVPVCENTHDYGGIDHYHTDRLYAFATDELPANQPGKGESTDLRWVTADELSALDNEIVFRNIKEIGHYALTFCAHHWERVPLSDFAA